MAIGVVFVWHMSLLTADNPEVVRPVILAYIVVCFPIGLGVMLVLAFLGWISVTEAMGTGFAALVVVSLFFGAGWYQWFRVAPWLVSVWTRSFRLRQARDQTPD